MQEGQKETERESQANSTLSTEPNVGLDPTTLRSWYEPKIKSGPSTNCATQEPHNRTILNLSPASFALREHAPVLQNTAPDAKKTLANVGATLDYGV